MNRPLIAFLLKCRLEPLLFPTFMLAPVVALIFVVRRQPVAYSLWTIVLSLVVYLVAMCVHWSDYPGRLSLVLWRLGRRVAGFRTVSGDRVTLLFPASLEEALDLQEVVRWCESDLDSLSQRFAVDRQRRLTVVLIPSHEDLSADFGQPTDCAVVTWNAVVIAADCVLRDAIRRVLIHLFAHRYNMTAPLPWVVGLELWLRLAAVQRPVGEEAALCLCPSDAELAALFDHNSWDPVATRPRDYSLVTGFTAFLIDRFGWDSYREYYRIANSERFRSRFERHFGMTLEMAWQWWREPRAKKTASMTGERPLCGVDDP
jgi:hypothetical protein